MAVDPNDLLIFKMRGMAEAKPAEKPAPKAGKALPSAAPQKAAVKPEEVRVKGPEGEKFAREVFKEREEESAEAAALAQQEAQMEETRRRVQELISVPSAEEERGPVGAPKAKRSSRAQKASAKGLNCVNHPWRPAYAVCAYCGRPFCYADLVLINGAYYDLDDADVVSRSAGTKLRAQGNTFSASAAVFFIFNALLLGYFIFPQIQYIMNYVVSLGLPSFFAHISSYYVQAINIALIALGIIAGLVLLARPKFGFTFSALVGALMLILISYEYLSTNSIDLLVVSVIAFVSIGVLTYSRVGSSTAGQTIMPRSETAKAATSEGGIEFPRIETF